MKLISSKYCALFIFLVFYIGSVYGKGLKVFYNVTDEEYNLVPKLFHLDDFDRCLTIPKSLYCFTTFQLSPYNKDKKSDEWKIIEEIISVPRSYRHDRIRHGICIPKECPNISKDYYKVDNGTKELLEGIAKCYNEKYKKLGLKSEVTEIHCENETSFYDIDYVDCIYACAVLAFISLVIYSTCYEGLARYSDSNEKYLELTETNKYGRFLTCFSLFKNWDRLVVETKPIDEALTPFQGVRVYSTILVVLTHTIMLSFLLPIQNPKFVEEITLSAQNMFVSNGGVMVQSFFLISAWLLSYQFFIYFENKEITYINILMIILNRLCRLIPILIIIVGFNATWIRHISRGPVWDIAIGNEYRNCRKNGIWNVLFINNYINANEMCLQQTWYISSEMQVFLIGLLIIKYVIKNQKHALKIFIGCILFGSLMTFFTVYYRNFDIVLRSYPELLYKIYMAYDPWLEVFAKGHHQLAAYVLGLAFGYYFYVYKKEQKTFLNNRVIEFFLFAGSLAVSCGTILIGFVFYEEGYEHTRFGAGFYQAASKMTYTFSIGLLMFGFCMGHGSIMRQVVVWKPLNFMARLSYSAYLIHTVPMRIKRGMLRAPTHIGNYEIIYDAIGDIGFTYIAATAVCLFFEMPFSALQKLITSPTVVAKQNEKKIK